MVNKPWPALSTTASSRPKRPWAVCTHLEQGNDANVSVEVLDAIAKALQLDETEHAHLTHLLRPTRQRPGRPSPRTQRLRPAVQQLLDSMTDTPAYVNGFRMDILGWNRPAAALFGDWGSLPPEERDWGRLIFLSPTARELFVDWEAKAGAVSGILRMHAGGHPEQALVTYHAEPGSESATALRPLTGRGADATAPAG
jgi:hypothetical protein